MSTPVASDNEVVLTIHAPGNCVWTDTFTARDEEILQAVIDCVSDVGLARMSVADIAERAHASKATLYRRFGSREGLILAAFTWQARAGWAPVDSGSLRDDLVHCATNMANHMTRMGTTLIELGAEMRHNTELARMMREEFFVALNELVVPPFERAKARGEVADTVDAALLWEAVKATMLYRIVLLGEPVGRLPEVLIDRIVMPAVSACPS